MSNIQKMKNVHSSSSGEAGFVSLEGEYPLAVKGTEHASLQPVFWRPILRGARAVNTGLPYSPPPKDFLLDMATYHEIHCDGLVEMGFISCKKIMKQDDYLYLPPHELATLFTNLIYQADRMRRQAGHPVMEYAVDVEMQLKGLPAKPVLGSLFDDKIVNCLMPDLTRFPRYSLGSFDEFDFLLNMFFRDFWNSLGLDFDVVKNPLKIQK